MGASELIRQNNIKIKSPVTISNHFSFILLLRCKQEVVDSVPDQKTQMAFASSSTQQK